MIFLQKDVEAESAEILKLGLLFGEDIQATTEDFPAVLSFQHKLLQEYCAAIYIAENINKDKTSTFLAQAFPTWEKIDTQREVVQFSCGILAETDASPLTNHVATFLAQTIHNEVDTSKEPSIMPEFDTPRSLLVTFQREGMVPTSEYPACGCALAEVLTNTKLVYITDIDENDALQLNPSRAQIVVHVKLGGNRKKVDSEKFDKLWQALPSVATGIIALHLEKISSAFMLKLNNLTQLKYIHIEGSYFDHSKLSGEDLAESMETWGPQPQLTYCRLLRMTVPRSLIKGLSKCSHLIHLDLQCCNLHENLDVLMASPPQGLRDLILQDCSLSGTDVDYITQAILESRLTHLQEVNISRNPVGEVAVGHLLEAIISIRPHTEFKLGLYFSDVNEESEEDEEQYTKLPEQFKTKWKAKLKGTNVEMEW